ncbi:MAG: ATP-dependent helicase, partial [Burkholderiaceae bacterium]
RGTRGAPPSRASARPPADDLFSKPYEPSAMEPAVPEQAKESGPQPVEAARRPTGRVSALLGGGKK